MLSLRVDPEMVARIHKISKAGKNFAAFAEYLACRGWGVPAHSLAATTFWQPLMDTDYNFALAEEHVAAYYETIALDLAEIIAEQPALAHLKPAIDGASKAHSKGDYAVAVPIWLVAIEATGNAICERTPPVTRHKMFSAVSLKKYQRSFERLFVGGGHRLRGLLATTISNMSQSSEKAKDFEPTVNRHAALHGRICYAARDDSLRALTVLFSLIDEGMKDEVAAERAARKLT
jgi:hypothetical protein